MLCAARRAGLHAPGTKCCSSVASVGAPLEGALQRAALEAAELRSQLRAQNSLYRQQNAQLKLKLQAAERERAEQQAQIASLIKDLHTLAEKMQAGNLVARDRVERKGVIGKGAQSRMAYRPDVEFARGQPSHVCELNHQSLAELAMLGDHCARRERLLREIMAVDNISWGQAHEVLHTFDTYKERYYWLETLPYRLGIAMALVGGIVSIFLVFSKPFAEWYAYNIVGEGLPDGVKDISELTTNQVGLWTWSWMEPMIGTASFVLLCCQFMRAQACKMKMYTYGDHLLRWRAKRLVNRFPQYDKSMMRAWAQHMPMCGLGFFPTFERKFKQKGPFSGL